MPGGSAYEIQDSLGSSSKSTLTGFLDQGGHYVGMCAGGYYAAAGYYWKGDDGAPVDNCKDQFCRYGITGTFSYDTATRDFTRHRGMARPTTATCWVTVPSPMSMLKTLKKLPAPGEPTQPQPPL